MAAYSGGDLEAFEVLFARHRRALLTFLVHRVGEREAAEDLLQEIFLRVIRARGSFDGRCAFRPWLYAIARNAIIDGHRRKSVRAQVQSESALAVDAASSGGGGTEGEAGPTSLDRRPAAAMVGSDPIATLAARDLRARIETALALLPEAQREVFLLRERARLDYEHISEVTGVGLATVKSRMRYALAALRRHLEDLPEVAPE